MLIKAFCLALKAHKGQRDKGGKPYILHPVFVSLHVKGTKRKQVALLHDVVEDTPVTLEMLAERGFSDDVIKAVDSITKRKGEPYLDYIERVKGNSIACDVKIADLKHNSNLKRLKVVTEKDIKRSKKYNSVLNYLNNDAKVVIE